MPSSKKRTPKNKVRTQRNKHPKKGGNQMDMYEQGAKSYSRESEIQRQINDRDRRARESWFCTIA